jgi:hypothetical protein
MSLKINWMIIAKKNEKKECSYSQGERGVNNFNLSSA